MTDRTKNLFVGLTVLTSLVLLGWMILQFGGVAISPFTAGRPVVSVLTDRADGIGEGSPVLYRGVGVGQVRSVRMADDMTYVVLSLQMNPDARVPANVEGIIRPQGLIGGSSAVFLELTDTVANGRLTSGAELRGHVTSMELLPKEISQLATDLRKTSQQFRESGVVEHLDQAIQSISTQAAKVGTILDSIQKIVGDEKMRTDIQNSLQNINEVTTTAKSITDRLDKFSASLDRTGANLDRLSAEATEVSKDTRGLVRSTQSNMDQLTRQVGDRLVQIGAMLETLSSVTKKLDEGKGTAGMLVNDPKLYEALVDSARQLNLTLADLKRLVQQWEQEGMGLRLK
jgi:phospholipid/cholesterol/gamma-HCH transport system substrate-binding protein